MIRPAVLLLLLAACAPREAPPPAETRTPGGSGLAYLIPLAGQYPGDARLWDTEPLRSRMTRLLGGDHEAFLRNIRTSGPISLEDGLVFVTGTCPSSEKVWGAAVLVADPGADRVVLKMYSEQWDSVRTYQDGEIGTLPRDVSTTLASWVALMERGGRPAPQKAPARPEPG